VPLRLRRESVIQVGGEWGLPDPDLQSNFLHHYCVDQAGFGPPKADGVVVVVDPISVKPKVSPEF
jgi:hypothetical protein